MKLDTLIVCPTHMKLFVDMVAATRVARRHHPTLTVDVWAGQAAIPAWWSFNEPWFRVLTDLQGAREEYDLIINTSPDERQALALGAIKAHHRSGLVHQQGLQVQGRWAQTLLAQLGAKRFSPFTPHDLFSHVLLGQHPPVLFNPRREGQGKWVIDLDSFPAHRRSFAEEMLRQAGFAHPGRACDSVPLPVKPSGIDVYIGMDPLMASWLSAHDAAVVLLIDGPFDPISASAGTQTVYQFFTASLTPGQVLGMAKAGAPSVEGQFVYSDEFLGGNVLTLHNKRIEHPQDVFDRLHYVVLNFLNELREVDLPIPDISPACCLHLKGLQSVFAKIIHLNQFGIKFLQDFLGKVASGEVTDADVTLLGSKIQEIDLLTEKTLAAWPEMDVYRLVLKFTKASAQGQNVIEVAKSMILVLHESNQALSAYSELVGSIVKKQQRANNTAQA